MHIHTYVYHRARPTDTRVMIIVSQGKACPHITDRSVETVAPNLQFVIIVGYVSRS